MPAAGVLAAAIPVALAVAAPAASAGQSAVLDAQGVQVWQQSPARPLATSVPDGLSYVVAAGDTLSGVAGKVCGDPGDWPGIWHANQAEVPNPDLIYPGQTLRFTCDELSQVPSSAAVQTCTPCTPCGRHIRDLRRRPVVCRAGGAVAAGRGSCR